MKLAAAALIVTALATAPSFAGEHRELGAHVHGHGTLDIAIEDGKVALSLEAPGMDILGFEHAAHDKDEQAAVERARRALSAPLSLFKIPPSAGCKVIDAKVALAAEHEHEEREEDADHTKGGHDHDAEGGHTEVHATYTLECAKPAEITSIGFDYFKAFAGAERLTVNVVTAKAQKTYEVTRDKPMLELGGMM